MISWVFIHITLNITRPVIKRYKNFTGELRMSETKGVIYLSQGTKCVTRALVSIYSLRQHYQGPITVLTVATQPEWLPGLLKEFNCDMLELENNGTRPLVRKAQLWRNTPYDLTLFLDADTLVVAPIDEYFDKIKEYTFCTGEFAGWKTKGGTMSKRIRSFGKLVPDYVKPALEYGKATNTGIFGFTRDAAILEEWEWITREGAQYNRIPDEVGCCLLLPRYKHWLAPVQWGVSVKMSTEKHYEDMKIVHYHGRKHAGEWELCALWKQAYWGLRNNHPDYAGPLGQGLGDRRFTRYIKAINKKDVTVVSAVNQKYLPKLKHNYPMWMKTEGIMEHPMILFVNGVTEEDLSFLNRNVKIIQWDMPEAANTRELMLSAFVFGTAEHVTSKYWLKVDCDTTPKPLPGYAFGYKLILPEKAWSKSIVGHRCGYTKSKKGYVKKHFLNILDEWWKDKMGEEPIFPLDIPYKSRHGHKRLASYICLHKSEFVRKCASLFGDRLPVPSHDTTLWYMAERMSDESWGRMNFKKHFQP